MIDILAFCEEMQTNSRYKKRIVTVIDEAERGALFANLEHTLHPAITDNLAEHGIRKLYKHQANAVDLALDGNNVILVTGTASGKTLAYTTPIIDALLKNPKSKALLIYPTKALAQDQLTKIKELPIGEHFRAAVYDGDTPKNERRLIRQTANIILTNPDMLHVGILPYHNLWSEFFHNLSYIVIDEVHTYRGIFGAHLSQIMRRLNRIALFYSSNPKYICCSATIGNPQELAEKLTGKPFSVIQDDGSPKGRRKIFIWNPPLIGEGDRRSANIETSEVLAELISNGIRTIAFNKSRIATELVLRYLKTHFNGDPDKLNEIVQSYRGGYTPEQRRTIEKNLFEGRLIGVTATNALELGIDIGGLDAVIINGYPGSQASFRQQMGRAGRSQEPSIAFYVVHNDPLEQFYARHPELLLSSAYDKIIVNIENPHVVKAHLQCAVYERPLDNHELALFSSKAEQLAVELVDEDVMVRRGDRWFSVFSNSPAMNVNIRSARTGSYEIIDKKSEKKIGTIEDARAFEFVHTGAIYLHMGNSYYVHELSLNLKQAYVEEVTASYFTRAILSVWVEPEMTVESKKIKEVELSWGSVKVTEQVTGYRKIELTTEDSLGLEELKLPERVYDTMAVWLTLPEISEVEMMKKLPGFHALEHTLRSLMPIVADCDRNDIGSAWYVLHPSTLKPTIFIYDKMPGGVGLAEAAFAQSETWIKRVTEIINECDCEDGCPACVYMVDCPECNDNISKTIAKEILKSYF